MTEFHTEEEVREATLAYFDGDELATNVWVTKYALRDLQGRFLEKTPDEMHRRLAKEFARVEETFGGDRRLEEGDIFEYLDHFRYIVPQGSPMYGIGNNHQKVSLSNCVVVSSPEDSMSSIMDRGRDLANLFKRRCGVGLDLSELRPEGEPVQNAAGTTTGAWSFADLYSYVCRMVGQNGRRGALMLTLDVRHPDVFQFVRMKQDLTKVTGANVSLKITDDFMIAVEEDKPFDLRWPIEDRAQVTSTIQARDLWEEIVQAATNTAEPGLLMWDNITSTLPAHCYPEFKTVSTNPCSEIALSPGDSCRLISLNLKGLVKNKFTEDAYFDYEEFRDVVSAGMRLIDDLVTLEEEKLSEIKGICDSEDEKALWSTLLKACTDGRRTGLGTHALADALACLNLRYDSEEGIQEIARIYKTLRDESYRESVALAKERGAFPVFDWELEKDNIFIQDLPPDILADMAIHGRRNISILTNAPTGSVSICSQTSSGIEPVFRNYYKRRRKLSHNEGAVEADFVDDMGDRWEEYRVYHHNVEDYIAQKGIDREALPDFFVESNDIDWAKRVDAQATLQKYIDHSVSSTINLPKGTSPDVVGDLYLSAWKKGLKGVTIYVDGSRSGVLLEDNGTPEKKEGDLLESLQEFGCTPVNAAISEEGVIVADVRLPAEFSNGPTHTIRREGNKYYMHLSYLPNDSVNPIALWIHSNHYHEGEYVTLNRAFRAMTKLLLDKGVDSDLVLDQVEKIHSDAYHVKLGKVISMALRHNISLPDIVGALRDIEGDYIATTLTAVRKFLTQHIPDGTEATTATCSTCGSSNLIYEGGCDKCLDCGASGC